MPCNLPLYLQVARDLEDSILSGQWDPGQDIPAIRSLAVRYHVNPSTVQHALYLLREENLIDFRQRRSYVTRDTRLIHRRREEQARSLTSRLCQSLLALGYTRADILPAFLRIADVPASAR